jgi:hypothetical protein
MNESTDTSHESSRKDRRCARVVAGSHDSGTGVKDQLRMSRAYRRSDTGKEGGDSEITSVRKRDGQSRPIKRKHRRAQASRPVKDLDYRSFDRSLLPNCRQGNSLSDADKTARVRRFASRITALVYDVEEASEIILTVPLKPSMVDEVNAKAQKDGLSVEDWLSRTVEKAVQQP